MKFNAIVSEGQYGSTCKECPYIRAAVATSEDEPLDEIRDFDDIPPESRILYCWVATFLPVTDQEQVTKYFRKRQVPPEDCPKEPVFNMAGYEIRKF